MKISMFQGILLAVFGLAGLIGIFVFATHSNNASKTQNTIGSVVIWGTLPKNEMSPVLTKIADSNTTLKNVRYTQKAEASLPSALSSAIVTGTGPDLVLASQEDLLSLAKFIAPIPTKSLPEATFKSSFIHEADLLQTPDGSGYYGIPFLVDPLVLFYNRSILDSSGIAKPPSTWEALTGLVPNVAVFSPTKQVLKGLIALGTYANVHDARGILSALFLQMGIPISTYQSLTPSASLATGSSGNTTVGASVVTFYTQFADPSKISYTWNSSLQDSQAAFAAGDLALYLGYSSEAAFLAKANPNLNFNVAPIPQSSTAKTKSTYGLLYSFMIPRGAKNPSGAYQVAALFSNQNAQSAFASALGMAPASLTTLAASSTPSDPVTAVAYKEALYANGWLSPTPANTDSVFSTMVQNVITGRLSATDALTSAQSALSVIFPK